MNESTVRRASMPAEDDFLDVSAHPPVVRQQQRPADGPANRRLHRIARLLGRAGRAIDAFLARHPRRCRCAFCCYLRDSAGFDILSPLHFDLRGARWAARIGEAMVRGVTLAPTANKGGQPQAEADAPAVVPEKGGAA